jgi:hypothetical protein
LPPQLFHIFTNRHTVRLRQIYIRSVKEKSYMFNFKSVFAVAALFLGGVTAANAQLVDGSRISVSVPNAFVLRDTTLPAGEYTIERTPSTADSPSILIIRGEDEAMVFDTMKSESPAPAAATQLVFDTVGGTTYLTEILVKGSTAKNQIVKTKRYKQALNDGTSSRVYVTVTNTGF